jgi:hypothetical protein
MVDRNRIELDQRAALARRGVVDRDAERGADGGKQPVDVGGFRGVASAPILPMSRAARTRA